MRRRFQLPTILSAGCAGLLTGLWIARYGIVLPAGATVAALPIVLLARRRTMPGLVAITALGLLLGLARGAPFWRDVGLYQEYFGTPVVIQVRAVEDAVYDRNKQLAFTAESVEVSEPDGAVALPGRVAVSGFGEPMVYSGDIVQVSGKLKPTRGGKVARIGFAELTVTGRTDDWLQNWRRRYAAGVQSALPEPMASFGLGILVGQRSTLSQSVSDDLSAAGLTHLVAVSGYNLTILVGACKKLFGKRSHFMSTAAACFLIVFFLLCTGFSASIVRAAIVAGLSLLAGYYGRSIKPVLLILLAACITAVVNPIYLWFDIGHSRHSSAWSWWRRSSSSGFGRTKSRDLLRASFWKPPWHSC
jgi:hypothetical protein